MRNLFKRLIPLIFLISINVNFALIKVDAKSTQDSTYEYCEESYFCTQEIEKCEEILVEEDKINYPIDTFINMRVHNLYMNDTILLAMLINDECGICSEKEKVAVAQVVKNRVELNYKNYGSTYKNQIFAKQQFSGSMKHYSDTLNQVKWYSPFKPSSPNFGNPLIGKNVKYYPFKEHYKSNYRAAYNVLKNKVTPFEKNVVLFCNPEISTNRKFVDKMLKTKVVTYKMVYSYDPDIKI